MNQKLTFVIPCLDEEYTLPFVLKKINSLIHDDYIDRSVEIIVSDNGSKDKSVEIAEKYGARVVNCKIKGYGAALKCGIENANDGIIIFADADNTYNFLEAPELINELEKGFDLVIGNRLDGPLKEKAMPRLHRIVGTPTLNFIINFLYSKKGNKIKDCNSGFRCFQKSSFLKWDIKGDGMEFASEMLIKALKNKANISHVPITLYPDMKEDRIPHLKTWRDGMRHLLQILMYAPKFFHNFGLLIFSLAWTALLVSFFAGPLIIGNFSIFGLHTMMFSMLGSFLGVFLWSLGLFLYLKSNDESVRDYEYIVYLKEDILFFQIITILIISGMVFLFIFIKWYENSFVYLSLEKTTMLLVAFISNSIYYVGTLISTHLLKRF